MFIQTRFLALCLNSPVKWLPAKTIALLHLPLVLMGTIKHDANKQKNMWPPCDVTKGCFTLAFSKRWTWLVFSSTEYR